MVIHEIDANSTWIEPMKNKTQGGMIKARRNALKCMQLKGIVPLHQILDNKISVAYKEEILAANMSYQLVPPDNHHQHISERAIQTWKSHFIGVLAGIAATFPLHLWCQIIPQAERQIILVSQTNLNPKISAYAYVYGQHEYNSAPFVPIVMESLVHDKPNKIKTFAEHCRKGYVLGTPFEHYCAWHFLDVKYHCHQSFNNSVTQAQIHFKPKHHPADAAIYATGNLASALKGKFPASLQQSLLEDLTRLSVL